MVSILDLPVLVKKKSIAPLASKILSVSSGTGSLILPVTMESWASKTFKGVDVESQSIVSVENKVFQESALFNSLRALRPIQHNSKSRPDLLERSRNEPLAHSKKLTPPDVFGRVEGKYCITASNVAKYDALHGLIIFKGDDPYDFKKAHILDFYETSMKWFKAAHKQNSKAKYPFLIWNCLWRAAGSMVHGHWQVLLSEKPYIGVKKLESATKKYKGDFWSDYASLHSKLGLSLKLSGVKAYAHVCPKKEKEVIISSKNPKKLFEAIAKVLKALNKLGTESFDMAVFMPPLKGNWSMPWVVRILDRGPLDATTVDIGTMELYAASVVGTDPFVLAKNLRRLT